MSRERVTHGVTVSVAPSDSLGHVGASLVARRSDGRGPTSVILIDKGLDLYLRALLELSHRSLPYVLHAPPPPGETGRWLLRQGR